MTSRELKRFAGFTQKALRQFLNEEIEKRFNKALETPLDEVDDIPSIQAVEANDGDEFDPSVGRSRYQREDDDIETTTSELQAFHLIRSLLSSTVDENQIYYRDSKSYFAIFYTDNNRKTICRLYFNNLSDKGIQLYNDEVVQYEKIEDIQEIEKFKENLIARVNQLK